MCSFKPKFDLPCKHEIFQNSENSVLFILGNIFLNALLIYIMQTLLLKKSNVYTSILARIIELIFSHEYKKLILIFNLVQMQ